VRSPCAIAWIAAVSGRESTQGRASFAQILPKIGTESCTYCEELASQPSVRHAYLHLWCGLLTNTWRVLGKSRVGTRGVRQALTFLTSRARRWRDSRKQRATSNPTGLVRETARGYLVDVRSGRLPSSAFSVR
jgi:hypothetical protein